MKCSKCGSNYGEYYYKDKNSNEIICEDCLLEIDEVTTSKVTSYFLYGEFIGDDEDIEEVIENICDNFDYEEVKED